MTSRPRITETERLLRALTPHVLGAVVRRHRDFAASEDAVQEALLAATTQWPRDGTPDDPRAWLVQVASRRMTDHVRSEVSRRRREAHVVSQVPSDLAYVAAPDDDMLPERDDTLELLFTCCHPALSTTSAIALTLRAVGGLTTAEIAHAFFVPETTMAQRISRAKQSIKASGIPLATPTEAETRERLRAVLHVLYLIFNEGYTSTAGTALARDDLSSEAIRLMRAVRGLVPEDGEVIGLLALMLLTDARRSARTTATGELVPLTEQDRSQWDRAAIDEGIALVTTALSKGSVGEYQLQAAIAAVHDEAETADETDWPQILALYGVLERMSDNPMVTLNRAIAASMVHGPRAGLELLAPLDEDARIAEHHRLHAVRAHLLEHAGDHDAAISGYLAAAARATNIPERTYLLTRAARLREQRS